MNRYSCRATSTLDLLVPLCSTRLRNSFSDSFDESAKKGGGNKGEREEEFVASVFLVRHVIVLVRKVMGGNGNKKQL